MENWDIACVIVQNDKVLKECKDKQRALDPVVVALDNEISGRNFCKGRRIVTSLTPKP